MSLRTWAGRLRRDVAVLGLAARDPRVPIAAKALALVIGAYALSPIDLIPDFIPVVGLLDDLLIVPAGIWLTFRMIPPPVLEELRARTGMADVKRSFWGAVIVVGLWLGAAAVLWAWLS